MEQGIAECEPGRDAVFLGQSQNFGGGVLPGLHAAPAPDAIRRSAVDGADVAPVVKIFPMFPEQWQKYPV